MAGGKSHYFVVDDVEHIHAMAAIVVQADFFAGDQIHRDMIFQQSDIGVAANPITQRQLHRVAGGIGGVYHAAVAVAAFTREMVAGLIPGLFGELHTLSDQPFDFFTAMLDDNARHFFVAQTGTGDQSIADMLLDTVARSQHSGNAALRPIAGAIQQGFLGDHRHL